VSNQNQGSGVDFSVFGPVESRPVSRVQQFVAGVMERNWNSIPHVTHNDEADISLLTPARKALSQKSGVKVTPLAFLIKAAVKTLQAMPNFNASLDADGKNLILKQYYHIGFAVDTPAGLLVPVIQNADQKSLVDIATEVAELSEMARTKGLPMDKMSGGCFTISSLGSIGGTSFSPIINAPEVAIMGITKAYEKPFNDNGNLVWKTVLPMSLSYDHRVINGADAARFCVSFGQAMTDAESLIESD
jgi:pyruvate dehydrogenase E2 component (dihydrolipoyllysine-residue acetyltransferase)